MKSLLSLLILAMSFAISFASDVSASGKTPTEKVQFRIRQKLTQIQRFVLLGNWSKDHAKPLKAQVEAIQKKEKAFLKKNRTNTLTDDQVTQLNKQLNALSTPIPTTSKTKDRLD